MASSSRANLTQLFPTALSSPLLFFVLAGSIAYVAYRIFYNLYLHPLAGHPGPLLGRITQWYDVYHAYIGDKHINFHLLHQRYGPVVRFSPNSLSINEPAALKAIYSHGANVQKSDFYVGFRAAPGAISTLLATDQVQHARKRRIMGQAFSDHAMRGLETYVLENVRVWMNRLDASVEVAKARGDRWTEELNMGEWNNYLVFDIMGDLVFGKSFGCLRSHENTPAIYVLGRAARRNYTVTAMPWLWRSGAEKYIPLLRGLYLDRQKYFAFAKAQVMGVMQRNKENKSLETGRKDIFTFLLKAKDPETGEGLHSEGELLMEGNTLIVAGSDTSSTTLSAVLYYLVRHSQCLQRLGSEVRSAFRQEEDIRMGPEMQSCAYLRACIDEAMRMTPAVAGLLPRLVLPGGLHIPELDLHVPAGVDVGACTYAIHRHPDYVVEPFKYDPSRFLSKSSQKVSPPPGTEPKQSAARSVEQDREALLSCFAPFSLGHRACLGKPLVYMEISIAIARLVWRFDLRYVEKVSQSSRVRRDVKSRRRHADEYHTRDWFLGDNEGPWVKFAARVG